MANDFMFMVEGIDPARAGFEQLPENLRRWAMQAINRTATHYRAETSRDIRKQVAFRASYLSQSSGRLAVTQRASQQELEARITGRHRPTSLARFATSGTPDSTRRRGGVPLEINPGQHTFMARAFLIKLRAGKADIETKRNLGLAIRLKPGEKIRNKRVSSTTMGKDRRLHLLYGPSVDQVFDDVAKANQEEAAEYMEREFIRLVNV